QSEIKGWFLVRDQEIWTVLKIPLLLCFSIILVEIPLLKVHFAVQQLQMPWFLSWALDLRREILSRIVLIYYVGEITHLSRCKPITNSLKKHRKMAAKL